MQKKSRHILKKNWTKLRTNIQSTTQKLALKKTEFKAVANTKWELIEQNIEKSFLYERKSSLKNTWLWEDIKSEILIVSCNKNPYTKLDLLINPSEIFYFFVNETVNESTKYWYYEGKVKAIIDMIGHTKGIDEYYLVSKKYNWFLCVNHYDVLIASGSIITQVKLNKRKLKS